VKIGEKVTHRGHILEQIGVGLVLITYPDGHESKVIAKLDERDIEHILIEAARPKEYHPRGREIR